MTLIDKPLNIAIERFSSSVWGYFNLWSYFDNKLKHRISSRKTHKIKSCFEFYSGIKDGKIKNGDKIILEEFFVSEWIPRVAGGLAEIVKKGQINLEDYHSFPTSYKPINVNFKSDENIPPLGSIRFPLVKKKDIILSAVSANEFHIDMGIVLSVSESIYSEFLSKQYKNNSVEATIEGYLDLFNSTESLPTIPKVNEIISNDSISLPSIILRLTSPLEIKFKTHNSHPRFNAWFFRRIEYSKPRIESIEFKLVDDKSTHIKTNYGNLVQYNYINWTVFDNDPDEISMVRERLKKEFVVLGVNGLPQMNKQEAYNSHIWKYSKDHKKEDYSINDIDQLSEFDGRQISTPNISIKEDPRKNPANCYNIVSEILILEKSSQKKEDH